MSKVGVTATRKGLGVAQRVFAWQFLMRVDEVHHGDCIGGDAEVDEIAKLVGCTRVGHPCTLADQRAHCECQEIREPKPPLVRNRDIVDEVEVMLAFPSSHTEEWRGSGTWATIRYARRLGRELWTVYPDGAIERTKGGEVMVRDLVRSFLPPVSGWRQG
jgi:hypothetical protein